MFRFRCLMAVAVLAPVIGRGLDINARAARGADATPLTGSPVVSSEFIFDTAPFRECHASTIAEVDGTLVAAWFGGTREQHQDVGIWLARRDDRGWSKPVEVANGVQSAEQRHPC